MTLIGFFCRKYEINEFKNPKNSTFFPKTMKIGTHGIKDIHSTRQLRQLMKFIFTF
jgi:hypothetical protein